MEKKFITQREIHNIYGIPRSTMYKLIKTEGFPPPVKIGARKSLWRVSEIECWFDLHSRSGTGKRKC